MNSVIRAFRGLTWWGVSEDTAPEEANYIRLTNAFLLLLFAGSICETLVLFMTRAYSAAMLNSTAPLLFGGGLLMMRTGRTRLARIIVLTISYSAAYLMATILGPESLFQFIILFTSAIAFNFFPLKEWKYVGYGLCLSITAFVALEWTNYQPVFGFERAQFSASQLAVLRLTTGCVGWLLVVSQFTYFIRSRKLAQEQLVSSAKMVALGQMAAGIAHEINNPLAVISGYAQRLALMVEDGAPPDEEVRQIASKIENTSNRIGVVVHGLRALSRDASEDPFVPTPLGRLVDLTLDCCRVRIQKQGVSLRMGEIPGHWSVMGREAQISEVLLNLINNSLDAIENLNDRWIEIKASLESGNAEIAISDSGNGIPAEIRRKMFDPFFTTKPVGKGTGLGLSVSRGILAAHRGQISFDEKSPWTRFVIRIPVA